MGAVNGTADLVVTVHDEKHGELAQPAKVTLLNRKGEIRASSLTKKGQAFFRGIPLDTYELTVEAPGYSDLHAGAVLLHEGELQHLDVILQPREAASGSSGTPPPSLSFKEQKELTAGLRAMQAQKFRDAKKHFLSAAKTSPNHPDVDYLLGVLSAMTGAMETATQYFEDAATRYQHVPSLTALGEIYLVEGNLTEARQRLETALRVAPNSWRADQLLAAVFLKQHLYAQAIEHSELALQTGKAAAKGAQLTLAQALADSGDRRLSDQVLNELLRQNPNQEQMKEAKRMLGANREPPATANLAAQSDAAPASKPPNSSGSAASAKLLYASLPFDPASLADQYQQWLPPNIDDAVPPADNRISCPLSQILEQTGHTVVEFVSNVDRFSATETMNHQALNEFGLAIHSEKRNFNYLVSIEEFKPGAFDVQEFRDGLTTPDIFPEHVATVGTVALVFVFHPNYMDDFDFRCEGRTHQGGQDAWQIHFSQKPDHPPRLRSYRLANLYYRVGLKGRAWISTETFQVLRMESDLTTPVPAIRLRADHEDIQYGPVLVKRKQLVLWLPASAEIYLDFNGHRIHRQQELSDFFFFWVN